MLVDDLAACPAEWHGRGTMADHVRAYGAGCRCPETRRVRARYAAYRRYLAEPAHVDATGTRRRLQALVAIGYQQIELAELLGIEAHTIYRMLHGAPRVRRDFAERVALLSRRLCDRPRGEVPRANRARAVAKQHGWVSIAWWDDIDDPNDRPRRRKARDSGRYASESHAR